MLFLSKAPLRCTNNRYSFLWKLLAILVKLNFAKICFNLHESEFCKFRIVSFCQPNYFIKLPFDVQTKVFENQYVMVMINLVTTLDTIRESLLTLKKVTAWPRKNWGILAPKDDIIMVPT